MKNQLLLPSPSLVRRLCAMFYDFCLVIGLLFLLGAVMIGLRILLQGELEQGKPALGGVWQIPTFIMMIATVCHFFVYFWVIHQQTLAMQTWRIQVVDSSTGNAISLVQAYIRFFGALVSAAIFGLGYLWVIIDKDNRSWHDYLSGTKLILLPKNT